MAHASDAFLFGVALCLICAPALLGGKVDDDVGASEARVVPRPLQSVPMTKLVPATPVEPDAPAAQEPSTDAPEER